MEDKLIYVTHRKNVFVKYQATSKFAKEILKERFNDGDSVHIIVRIGSEGDYAELEWWHSNKRIPISLDLNIADYALRLAEHQGYR